MKKYLLGACLFVGSMTQAQFTLEHTYFDGATWNYCQTTQSQLMMVDFEQLGQKYVKIDRCNKMISIYNLNHSLMLDIDVSTITTQNGDVPIILYFSQSLFNLDNKIEFMYVYSEPDSNGNTDLKTKVYNEDLDLLFSENGAPYVIPTYHMQQYPIYNTPNGTKMILSYTNGDAKVFGLAGTLANQLGTQELEAMNNAMRLSSPFPNPAVGSSTINYVLPENCPNGEIVLYTLQGTEVKRFKVDNTFSSITITTDEIAAGNYYYQLQTKFGVSDGEKMIVVK